MDRIVLGSGMIYIDEFNGAIPESAAIEVEAKRLGLIQGGATLEYKPEFYSAADDAGLVEKTIITKEEVTLKSGVMTWCGTTLQKLCATAQVTEDTAGGKRTVKIGGVGKQDGKRYLIHFHHQDPVDGDIRINLVGNNQSGFTLAFAKDKETVIDAEFKAAPLDAEGTLIQFEEAIPIAAGS